MSYAAGNKRCCWHCGVGGYAGGGSDTVSAGAAGLSSASSQLCRGHGERPERREEREAPKIKTREQRKKRPLRLHRKSSLKKKKKGFETVLKFKLRVKWYESLWCDD